MHSLQEIKTRIGTIKKIKKITKAMQLVATAKLIKAKRNLEKVTQYSKKAQEIFNIALKLADNLDKIFQEKKAKYDLYILVTSDLGLCGSYNSNIIRMAKATIKPNDQIIIIGLKGKVAFKKMVDIVANYNHIGDDTNYLVASDIAKIATSKFWRDEIKEIKIIHTQYVNAINYNAMITTIVPFNNNFEKPKVLEYEFEPNADLIIKKSLALYVSAIIYELITQSKLAEITSRRTAMENASDNANELIENLNLEYNRARQAKITQEISEIVVGSELK